MCNGKKLQCQVAPGSKYLKASFRRIHPATINTWSTIMSFHWEKPLRHQGCEPVRTGRSKPIYWRTTPITRFIPASIITATRTNSAVAPTTTPMKYALPPGTNYGGGGNSCIREMPAFLSGLCGFRKTLSGVTGDYGATIRLPCWEPCSGSKYLCHRKLWRLFGRPPRRQRRFDVDRPGRQ